jgi:hypothetical protein
LKKGYQPRTNWGKCENSALFEVHIFIEMLKRYKSPSTDQILAESI